MLYNTYEIHTIYEDKNAGKRILEEERILKWKKELLNYCVLRCVQRCSRDAAVLEFDAMGADNVALDIKSNTEAVKALFE